jgi:hypothetical protein
MKDMAEWGMSVGGRAEASHYMNTTYSTICIRETRKSETREMPQLGRAGFPETAFRGRLGEAIPVRL